MAANSALSSDPSVKTADFQGQFGMSHQEALANVTAKAAQAHPQVQPQTESTKSLIKPLSKKKVGELQIKKGNSSYHTDEPPDDVPRTPMSDVYGWRKYGQKQVKSSGSSRSYYRCTSLSCCAKKKVQHLDVSGQVIDVVYKGDHNHDPPQNVKGSSRKKDTTPRALNHSSDSSVQNLDAPRSLTCEKEIKQLVPSTTEGQDENLNRAAGTPPRDVEEQYTKTVDTTSRLGNELATVPVVEEHSGTRSDNSNELAMNNPMKEPDVMPMKKRRIKERGKACSESVYRTFKDPKIVVHTAADVAMSSDGYRWRKYGQKMVKGNPHPRSYYRCSSSGCPVRKHVERANDNSTAMIVTYEGKHDHDIPTPKKQHHASPNYSPVSGANTVLDKSENEPRDMVSDLGEEKTSEAGGDKVLESARTLLSIGIELKSC
ncbi:probable WRKY transcription factor 32 isoform X2 [Beta vulgaris subsp. vulgaris]|nr:probable WRKY transcription factor 32 isoform X2 [Beta vulgaris subsp. vulgaris]